jgi:hypothetical protein
MGLFRIVMGVWVIGFRDIGYRACRRLFPWSSLDFGFSTCSLFLFLLLWLFVVSAPWHMA